MSTFTGIGPALALDGPLPVAPRHGLLTLPDVVRDGSGRELNGVNVWGYPVGTPSLWEPCLTGTYREKDDESDWDQPRFDAVAAYFPIQCSTITADPSEFAERAEAVLEATLSFAVEEALAQGVSGSTNPFLGDTNLTQLGGGAVAAQAGLNYLENAIGETGRQGVIHATPGTVSAWNYVNLLEYGDTLRTVNGTPVVSGGGYINTDPSGKTGSNPSVGQDWAFATGPVHVYIKPAPALQVFEYVEREDNIVIYRAERFFLAEWDTSLQSGVLIDWTP